MGTRRRELMKGITTSPVLENGPRYIRKEFTREHEASIDQHVSQPSLPGLSPRPILAGIVRCGNSSRRPCSNDLRRIERFTSTIGPRDQSSRKRIDTTPRNAAGSHRVVTTILMQCDRKNRLYREVLDCLIDKPMPEMTTVANAALSKRRI